MISMVRERGPSLRIRKMGRAREEHVRGRVKDVLVHVIDTLQSPTSGSSRVKKRDSRQGVFPGSYPAKHDETTPAWGGGRNSEMEGLEMSLQ